MPSLSVAKGGKLVKALNCGVSGGGKTGSLACLAKKYRLIIFDFDNGFQILQDPGLVAPADQEKIILRHYEDKSYPTVSGPKWSQPQAFPLFLKDLEKNDDMGPIGQLTSSDIIVLDSLTFCGAAIMRFVLNLNGRLNQRPWINDWGQAIGMQEDLLAFLYSNSVPCHVIINAHITWIGGDDGNESAFQAVSQMVKDAEAKGEQAPQEMRQALANLSTTISPVRGYPSALGKVLPPKVGRYFNTMVKTKTIGSGGSERRVILTKSESDMELKVPCPTKLDAQLPIKDGWLTLFKAITGE